MVKKVKEYSQKRDKGFDILDSDISCANIGDMKEILCGNSCLFLHNENTMESKLKTLVGKIQQAKDFKELQKEISGNAVKYFDNFFVKNGFEKQWNKIVSLRNKVAHNQYLTIEDLEKYKTLCANISSKIEEAKENEARNKFAFEAIPKDLFLSSHHSTFSYENNEYKKISPEILLKELFQAQNSTDSFVELDDFVENILGKKNYDYSFSRVVINYLAEEGIIEKEDRKQERIALSIV